MANLVGILASGVTDVGGKVRWKHEAGVKALETVGRGSMLCRQGVGNAQEKHERFACNIHKVGGANFLHYVVKFLLLGYHIPCIFGSSC